MKNFEQIISFHPTFKQLGDQPTIRDIIYSFYGRLYGNEEDARTATKRYLDEVNQVFENQNKTVDELVARLPYDF